MKKLKFTFKNAAGEELAGLLELPENPKAFALLAHCFTCGKDLKGAARIARKLTEKAIAVLRFDFRGLRANDVKNHAKEVIHCLN